MIKHLFIIIALFVVVGGSVLYLGKSSRQPKKAPMTGTEVLNQFEKAGVPNFEALTMNGEKKQLKDYKGQFIILNVWASWCEPCIREFPSMIQLINHFKGDLVMLAVSEDKRKEDVSDFLKAFSEDAKSPHLSVLWDPENKVKDLFKLQALPESFILDPDLKLIRKVTGVEDWYNEDTISFFEHLLKQNEK